MNLFDEVESNIETKSFRYNPWHGCFKVSVGCKNCFIYTIDSMHQKDSKNIYKTKNFYLPIIKNRSGNYKIPSNSFVWMCFSSDFLLKEADLWRNEVWEMIAKRKDVEFAFFTKRIERLESCLPDDWGDGYKNVIVGLSVENQVLADKRLPIFINLPIKRRWIIAAPLLEALKLEKYLQRNKIEAVGVGGERALNARICDYSWVLDIRGQCERAGVGFYFHQTGSRFKKDNKIYKIKNYLQQSQAKKAGIDIEI
ncbi:MAG: phage Gp37/Gp68 family protein [Helicobacteraceae bacterium]|nr:phage Gp37/Gp68 family protein [Helicobacteraceae bacterium]